MRNETDEEFLDRIADYLDDYSGIPNEVRVRLFALARRGAGMNDAVKCQKAPEHQDRRYNVAERLFGDD